MSAVSTAEAKAVNPRRRRIRRTEIWIYAFLLPTVVLYGLFTVYPIIGSYWYSLVDWNGFEAEKTFVGLANFAEVLSDPLFWNSFKITVIFTLVAVPVKVALALLLALLLNSRRLPFRNFFRVALFLPVVTTTAIVGVVMQFVFDPAGGPVNAALTKFGILDDGINFLGESRTALGTVIVVFVWKWLGTTLIYWLASLQTVPRELYEAASIDGASAWQTFRHLTVPLLKPFLIIITLLTVESTLQVFDLMLTMTHGGPFYATQVMEIYIYEAAFATGIPRLGLASAAAVLFGLFVCALGLLQLIGIRAARQMRSGQ
ncbi:carbohydrate ABC transporter permease [Propionibacteriaceae bacterium Y1685]|uniref:carbohydrate ABC transporter permease n=1 Tax=Microlunatus sp. Y1700 TaxID=3418487 RepID=UPI003B76BD2C